ncbi:MAG: hypothetical protein KJ069_27440 [Anaerolineae bacterium]|nr:hypothetical protein [Anaerolineae bacterium]
MNNHLDDLRRILTEPAGPHLDDEKLAEMVTAELSGEDVDVLYTPETAHLGRCPDCAAAYEELASLSFTAVAGMAAAAYAMTPQQAFMTLLQPELAEPAANLSQVIAALPLLFAEPPTTPEEFEAVLAHTTWAQSVPDVATTVLRHLAALTAYLTSTAAAVWGRAVDVQTAVLPQGHQLQLQPAPGTAVPVLSSAETGDEWHLLSRSVGHPVAWHVSMRAARRSATGCALMVHVDRPGLADADGRQVTIAYGGREETAVTDANGTATFPLVPIAALPTLQVTIDTLPEQPGQQQR